MGNTVSELRGDWCSADPCKARRDSEVIREKSPSKLQQAVQDGDARLVSRILSQEPPLINARGQSGKTPLHTAAELGHLDVTQALIAAKADPLSTTLDGRTAQTLASAAGHDHVAKMLREAAAAARRGSLAAAAAAGYASPEVSLSPRPPAGPPDHRPSQLAWTPVQSAPHPLSPKSQSSPPPRAIRPDAAAPKPPRARPAGLRSARLAGWEGWDVERLHAAAAEMYAAGDFDSAEALYLAALERNPRHLRTLCNYGALLHNIRRDYPEAARMYQSALLVDPDDVVSLYNYGLLLEIEEGDCKSAEALYVKALSIDRNHVNTLINYASMLTTVYQKYAQAKEMYERVLQVEPDNLDALCNYAILLRDGLGRPDEARDVIERARKRFPDDPWLRDSVGHF